MKLRIYNKQIIPEITDLIVFSPTKDYGPFDLIECALKSDPENVYAQYQAQFIKFGSVVYRESEYVELLKTLGLIDVKPENINEILNDAKSTLVIDKNPLETADKIDSGELREVPENKYVELEKEEETESKKDEDDATEQEKQNEEIKDILPKINGDTDVATTTSENTTSENVSKILESASENISTTTESSAIPDVVISESDIPNIIEENSISDTSVINKTETSN